MEKRLTITKPTSCSCSKGEISPDRVLQKRNLLRGLICFICCVFFINVSSAQSDPPPPTIGRTPMTITPEAYSFKQDFFRPISYYTGQANVSIPLYTIETNDISFPIELVYIGGEGLRPLNTYSSVGHGWRLSAGGAITRTINNVPDDAGSTPSTPSGFFNLNTSSGITSDSVRNNVNDFFHPDDYQPTWQRGAYKRNVEYSPDVFTFSFLGYSGYFVMDYNKKFKVVSENIVKVEKENDLFSINNLTNYRHISFILTSNDGTKFYFGDKPGSIEISGGSPIDIEGYSSSIEINAVNEAWYLTKIEFVNGNEVNINYHQNTENSRKLRIKTMHDYEDYTTHPVIIDNIVSENCTVSFVSNDKSHIISEYTNNNLRLINEINVTDKNSQLVSKIVLNNNNPIANKKYYMLRSVKVDNKPYSFTYYNESGLPSSPNNLITIGTDYWGFYNGKDEWSQTLYNETPTKDYRLNETEIKPAKEPSVEHTMIGVLTKITYPTGVIESFVYEPHSYYYYYSNTEGGYDFVNNWKGWKTGGLRIRKITTGDMERTFYYVTDFNPQNPNSSSNTSSGILFRRPINSYWTSSAMNVLSMEGEPHMTYSKVIEYRTDKSYTVYDMVSHNEILDKSNAHHIYNTELYGGLAFNNDTPPIIFNDIFEKSTFINALGKPSSRALERGRVKEISVYDTASNLVKKTSYTYNRPSDWESQYVPAINVFTGMDKNINPLRYELFMQYSLANYGFSFSFRHSFCIYTYHVYLEKETTTYYENGVSAIEQTINYKYSDEKLLSEIKTQNSNGDELITTFKYPSHSNYNTVLPYSGMVSANILSPVIEKVTEVNGIVTEKTKVNYKHEGGNLYVPASTQYSTKSNPLEDVATFDKYDTKGNILQMTDNISGITTSFIWGYDGLYPVAKIENATFNEVKTELNLNEQQIQALNPTANSGDLTKLKNLQSQLTQALVTIYTYKPLVGMTSQTDSNGITTYYEYDDYGRLKLIKDNDLNIVQFYQYNYQNETP